MSTETAIDTILEELYTVDPTFREKEASLRVLIAALLKEKPNGRPDADFVSRLRAQLLTEIPSHKSIPTPFEDILYTWVSRLAPVAAFALIILILIPGSQQSSTTTPEHLPTTMNETAPAADIYQKRTLPAPVQSEHDSAVESMSLMQTETPSVSSFGVPEVIDATHIRIETITLRVPSFLVIHNDQKGERHAVIGVSQLLPIGFSNDTVITLGTPLQSQTNYHLTLYEDSGDGSFSETHDGVAIDHRIEKTLSIPFIAEF